MLVANEQFLEALYYLLVFVVLVCVCVCVCACVRVPGSNSKFSLISLIVQPVCGLPLFHYFSAVKIVWLMENCTAVREAIDAGNCLFGTVDTWLIWVCSVSSCLHHCQCYSSTEPHWRTQWRGSCY